MSAILIAFGNKSIARRFAWPFVALAAVLGAFFGNDAVSNNRIKPPSSNCRFAELTRKVPPPDRLAVVRHGDATHLVWLGPIPPLTIRSGPPCYVFDDGGRLIDWCPETGEGWKLDSFVADALHSKSISPEDAARWIEKGRE